VVGVRRHALVIGAGLAGPATALFLRKVGITSTVYEGRPQAQGPGGGLVLAPNGMNVLAELGLADRIKARGTLALENRFCTEAGRRLARYSNGGTRYGQPAVAVLRDDLHAVMVAELAARAITVRYRKQLTEVARVHDAKVVARFEDGTSAEGDLLVGADGVQSRARASAFPEAPAPTFAGAVGVSGLAPSAAVPSLSPDDKQSLTFTFGARGLFCYCGTRGGDVMWSSNLCRAHPLGPRELEGHANEWLRKELLDFFGGYHAPIGPGASLALEDAMDLAKRLRDDGGDHGRAFDGLERDRRGRVERIVAEGRRRGTDKAEVTPLRTQVGHFARWVALNLFGRRSQDWVYRYRVDWGPVAAG
jgi:2-polyprenyl-6-methoxyphenol hydroxylase-like FAD-dependent oxidoreductase